MPAIRHRRIQVDGLDVFVREAGDHGRPTIVLLPGYPSSTHACVRLIDRLAPDRHVMAIDHPGYGNAYAEGLGPAVEGLTAWWKDRAGGQSFADETTTLAGTRFPWQAGAHDPELIDPEQARADQAVIDQPGRAGYMQAILWDYQTNPVQYPDWQAWLRRRQPAVLAIWGGNDPFFIPAGARAHQGDVPEAEVILLDTGHFALEEEADTIAEHTGRALRAALPRVTGPGTG